MPEVLSPGVYIQEFAIGATPIQGASTSTAGFIGMAEKGPTTGLPIFVSGINDFARHFGDFLPKSYGQYRYLAYAVNSFFTNGGSGCYVMRVAPSDARIAKNEGISAGIALPLARNATAGDTILYLTSLRGIDTTAKITLTEYREDGTADHHEGPLTIASYDSAKNTVTLSAAISKSYSEKSTLVSVPDLPGTLTSAAKTLSVSAINKGVWGNSIIVQVNPSTLMRTQIIELIGTATTTKQYKVKSPNGLYVGAIVEFDTGTTKQYTRITALQENLVTFFDHLTGDNAVVDTQTVPTKTISTCEFSLTIMYKDQLETFTNLSMNPDAANYFTKINGISTIVTVSSPYTSAANFTRTDPFDMPANTGVIQKVYGIQLSDGFDGTVGGMTAADYKGVDNGPCKRTGIEAFVDIDDVSIMAIPGVVDHAANLALIAHCENKKDRFAIIDIDQSKSQVTEVKAERDVYSSSYAALYHPWIQAIDPLYKTNSCMPPSGAIAGIYARSDKNIGVHKAPANEVVFDATDLVFRFSTAEQDKLNPVGVNLIRAFPGRGIRVWGARTLTGDPLWTYVNVRRLFIYLEKSIQNSTQWVVFEPNDIPLWARVKQTIVQFLTDQWRAGMLAGATADQAFFVRCDRTTMSQGDIDNGRLICTIGVAPVKPAEFVIFRIAQWTLGAKS